jgi:hypothetical protein
MRMSSQPSSFLGAVISQDNSYKNVTDIELEHGISAGVRLRSLGNGLIPVFEEHQVRIENRMTLAEWDEIPYMEKAMIVAIRRTDHSIKNLQAEAEIRENERQVKKGKR